MSDKVKLSSFPADKYEALALLYIQNQDLSNISPEELYDKYADAYDKIKKHGKKSIKYNNVIGSI